jgi:hypothetical protein
VLQNGFQFEGTIGESDRQWIKQATKQSAYEAIAEVVK